jgi:pSer/pThr/pTyr-binding forkhead associated (FHA) protein
VLQQGSTVLGRARGCDVELESPDVSSVHCVITRGPEGLRIRDLNSRAGTRLNGDRIRTEYELRDQDVIQLGPFSFEVAVPGPTRVRKLPDNVAEYQKKLERLERSRERLAEIALAMRRRLTLERAKQKASETEGHDPTQMKEVHRVLAERQEELEQRAAKLKEVERGLTARKAQLDKEAEAFRAQVQRHEHRVAEFAASQRGFDAERDSIMRELTELQAHLDRREQEIIRRQADGETELQEAYQELQHACGLSRGSAEISPSPLAEGEHRIQLRSRELGSFARHLRDLRAALHQRDEQLKESEVQLRSAWDRMREMQEELKGQRKEVQQSPPTLPSPPTQQSPSTLPSQDGEIQHQELGQLIENLARLYTELRQRQDLELQALRDAFTRLQQQPPTEIPASRPARFAPAQPAVKRSARPTERIPRELLDRLFNS